MTANVTRLITHVTVAVVATWSSAGAQPAGKVARLGVVLFETPATNDNVPAFLAGLRDLGYVEGRNLAIEYRYADGRVDRVRDTALEAVALKPDVIVVLGGDIVPFVKAATSAIPVVMLTSNDPVEAGLVASFARPGGNVTGVAFVSAETAGKRLQFLKEAAPSIARVAVLWTPDHPDGEYRSAEGAARRLGIQLQSLEVRRAGDLDAALDAAVSARADALMVVPSRFMNLNRARILEAAGRYRLPVVSGWGPWVRAGGLMSYGPDLDALVRRAATHVDKILRGARPADLPIEQPDKFSLVINTKTARAFGLTVPPSLLGRADHLIE
jgi:putative ABC transport system substrate-binding protein